MDDYPRRGPGGRGWGDGWGYMHDGLGWAGWLFMGVFLLFLVALVVAVVVVILRSTRPGGSAVAGGGATPTGTSTAEQLLEERFARGEIEEEEYLRRRSVLRGG